MGLLFCFSLGLLSPRRISDDRFFFAVRIVDEFALVIENNGWSLIQIEFWPVRQALMIGIPVSGKRNPGGTHLIGERLKFLAFANRRFGYTDMIEYKSEFHRVHRSQLAFANG